MTTRDDLIKQHNQLMQTLEQVRDQLLALPGVIAVGIGVKERGGVLTNETGITVFVDDKKPENQLPANAIVPKTLNGVKTDVIVKRAVQLEAFTDRVRPLVGGLQVQNDKVLHVGTLGCAANDNNTRNAVILSNQHVLYADGAGDGAGVGQPTYQDAKTCCCCTCRDSNIFGSTIRSLKEAHIDAAIANINVGEAFSNDVKQIGTIVGTEAPVLLEKVRKFGRTTEYTEGTVTNLTAYPYGGVNYYDIEVTPTAAYPRFTDAGDSGSVYVNDDDHVVGLHYAGVVGKLFPSLGNDIRYVMNRLAITIPFVAPVRTAEEEAALAAASPPASSPPAPWESNPLVQKYEAELNQSATGQAVVQAVRDHYEEVLDLVNHNRTVLTTWQSNQGPAFLQAYDTIGDNPDQAYNTTINGVSLQMLVSNMTVALQSEGSAGLSADIMKYSVQALNYVGSVNTLDGLIAKINQG